MTAPDSDRRDFLLTTAIMGAGLAASYGALALMAGRFLYPARGEPKAWLYLAEAGRMAAGDSFIYRAPDGASIAVARVGSSGQTDDFLALSSVCPHLGCQVHWEAQNNRFFCPCHNGAFDPTGKATAGPPAAAGQSLSRYPLKLEEGLLYIEVPIGGAAAARSPESAGGRAG
jgi:Rieske Fe-S protein